MYRSGSGLFRQVKITLIVVFLFVAWMQLVYASPSKPTSKEIPTTLSQTVQLGNFDLPTFDPLSLAVGYSNGTVKLDVDWDNILWGQVDQIGVKSQSVVGGFEKQYGSIVWYITDFHKYGVSYQKPIFYVFQRFWAKVGGQWYKQYLTTDTVAKTPFLKSSNSDSWLMGWTGNISYGVHDFPVSVAMKTEQMPIGNPDVPSNHVSLKTNVTTPIDLSNSGIEYQLYLNPEYVGDAQREIRWVKVMLNESYAVLKPISAFFNVTNVPSMAQSFSFYNDDLSVEVCTFNFEDVFASGVDNFAKIEEVTLPNGQTTYVVKVGSIRGALSANETMVIDPSFGYDTEGTGGTSITEDRMRGSSFLLSTGDCTVDNITWAIKISSSGYYQVNATCAMYSGNATHPTTLVGQTPITEVNSTDSFSWETFSFSSSLSLTNDTYYHLNIWVDNDEDTIWYVTYDSGTGDNTWRDEPQDWDAQSPGGNWSNWDIIPSDTYADYSYSVYCNYTLAGGDSTSPTYSNVASNATEAGSGCKFSCYWNDETDLTTSGGYIFSLNNTGSWANDTWTVFTATPCWANVSKTLNSTVGQVVGYKWFANDTAGNWNSTSISTLTTTDSSGPTYSNIDSNATSSGVVCLFSVQWNDNIALHTSGGYIFSTNNTGSWSNETWSAFSATPQWANVSKTLNTSIGLVIGFRWYANDTGNNWNNTGIQSLTITGFTLTLQARDKDGVNLPRAVSFAVTFPNSTVTSFTSTTAGLKQITTMSGTHSVTVTWQTHIVKTATSFSVTATKTQNFDTLISRLSVGSYYVLISLDSTTIGSPIEKPYEGFEIQSIQGSSQKQLKVDVANWKRASEPTKLIIAGNEYQMRSDGWSYSDNILTFDSIDFEGLGQWLDFQVNYESISPPSSSTTTTTVTTPSEPDSTVTVNPIQTIQSPSNVKPYALIAIAGIVGMIGVGAYLSLKPKSKWPSQPEKKSKWEEKK